MDEKFTIKEIGDLLASAGEIMMKLRVLPESVRELFFWKIADAAISSFLSAIALAGCFFVLRWSIKIIKKERVDTYRHSHRSILAMWIAIISLITFSFAAISFLKNSFLILQIWFSPKLYLLDYAAEIVS